MTPERWARLRGKTNDQVLAEARADPTALPVEDRKARLGPVARVALAKRIRWALHMSQVEFAKAFRIRSGHCAIGSSTAGIPIKRRKRTWRSSLASPTRYGAHSPGPLRQPDASPQPRPIAES